MTRLPKQADDPETETGTELDSAARGRRRFVMGGATTAVMLTIPGRPAWGSSCTPSATASANVSGRHDFDTCASKSAGYWKWRSRWPYDLDPDSGFHDYFGGSRFQYVDEEGHLKSLTLIQVINLSGGARADKIEVPGEDDVDAPGVPYDNRHQIGLHAVGALVNSYAFPLGDPNGDFGFTPQQVVDIYNMNDQKTAADRFETMNNQFDSG